MKKTLVSFMCVAFAFIGNAQNVNPLLTQQSFPYAPAALQNIYFYQYKPPTYNNTDLFPLIISLHGGGQAGDNAGELSNVITDGLPLLVSQGNDLVFTWQNKTEGFLMLAPMATRSEVNDWPTYYTDQLIAYAINNLRVDPNRIFLTGFSLGGGGVWKYATMNPNTAVAKLAGIVPVSSTSSGSDFCYLGSQKIAIWAFHGGSDEVIPPLYDQYNSVAVNSCSPPPIIPAVDTVIQNEGHSIYMSVTYDYTNTHHYPNVFQWMLKVNKNINPLTDVAPVPAIAGGPVINLTTPVKVRDFPTLDASGSYDNDDIIMDYLWTQTSGYTLNLTSPIFPVSTISDPAAKAGLPVGSYNFSLRVKDYLTSAVYNGINHTQFANLNVNIALPASGFSAPATDAGGTIYIANNVTQVLQRSGTAYAYPCTGCNVASYNWVEVPVAGGPTGTLSSFNGTQPYSGNDNNISFTNLNSPGTYQFKFTATTSHGDAGSDILTIIKAAGALPVTYSYFNGQNEGNKNVLNWATTSEINSARFDVLRSTDGINFTVVGSLTAKGNGSAITTYSFDDTNIPLGLTYYRLSQVDKDGKSSLSETISVFNKKTGLFIEKYPNPVHDNLTVTVQGITNGRAQMIVADMQGKTILQQQWQKDQSLITKVINVSSLQTGLYQIILTIGQEKQVSSFVKY